jgi:hypothetical protein
MSSVHLARQGFITKSALPSVTRSRGTVTVESNLMLYGAGKTTVSNNTTFIDSSTNNFTITRNGDTVQSGFNPFSGVSNGSGYFDGTGDSLSNGSANLTTTGDITVEFWAYLSSTSGLDVVVNIGNEASARWSFAFNNGAPVVDRSGSGTTTFGGDVGVNAWRHIAFVRSSNIVSCYVNGVSVGTPTSMTGTIGNTSGFYVGAASNSANPFQGYISNLRVVTSAVYTSNFTPPTSSLTAISGTSLLLLMDNYSIVNSTSTNLPVSIFGNTAISTVQAPTGMSSSIYLDGVGDYLTVPNNGLFQFGTGDYTIEWWQYQSNINPYPRIFSIGTYPTAFAVSIESSVFYYWTNTSAATTRAVTGVYNTWTHFAVSRLGNVTKLFRNGVQMGADIPDTANISNSSTALSIGAETTPAPFTYYSGYISNFRSVKGVALYTSNFTVPSAPLQTTFSASLTVTNSIYGVYQLA